jgi:RNA polymerase sigma factor (sigma-70 family)
MSTWNARATVDLVVSARRQQPEAWKVLFERCQSEMVRFCRRYMGPTDPLRRVYHSQDIVHEAFATAIQKIDTLKNDAAFYAWVRTIIRHKIAVKRRDELRDLPATPGPEEEPALDDDRLGELATCEESLRVVETILDLFPEYSEAMTAFALVHLEEGFPPEKLAEILGVSRRTAYRRLEEATKLLRARLEPDD